MHTHEIQYSYEIQINSKFKIIIVKMPFFQKLSFGKFKSFFKRSNFNENENAWEGYEEVLDEIIHNPEENNEEDNEDNGWDQEWEEEEYEREDDNNFIYILLLLFIIIIIPTLILCIIVLLFYLYTYSDLFIIKLLASKLNYEYIIEMDIDPFKLLFSQTSISSRFENGTLNMLIDNLVDGHMGPNNVSTINVCIINDQFHSLDNRRLYCFQEAIRRGAVFKKIPIRLVKRDGYRENEIEFKMGVSKWFIKNNDWSKVVIRR